MPYKEGKKWRAKVGVMGKRHTALLPTKKEALAWEAAKRKELKQNAGDSHQGPDLLTFCSKYTIYAERFSKKVYDEKKSLCKNILKIWESTTPVPNITPDMVQTYLDEQATIRSANASNKDRKNLLAMWNYGCKFLGLPENPVNVTTKRAHDRKPPYTPPAEDVLKVFMAATRNAAEPQAGSSRRRSGKTSSSRILQRRASRPMSKSPILSNWRPDAVAKEATVRFFT